MPCGHTGYCEQCLVKITSSSADPKCPVNSCRERITHVVRPKLNKDKDLESSKDSAKDDTPTRKRSIVMNDNMTPDEKWKKLKRMKEQYGTKDNLKEE